MKVKCEYCGSMIDDQASFCPNCGAPNANMKRTVDHTPKTIEELKAWYQARHLPPYETTRFFIGIDYKEPKAFGIYKEADGTCVVYKNKADGSRAVRYKGDDEAYAVNELFLKLKSEILNQKALNQNRGGSGRAGSSSCMSPVLKWVGLIIAIILVIFAATVNVLPAVIAAAVPLAVFFIVRAVRKSKGQDVGKLSASFPVFYIIYLIIMSLAVVIVTPARSRANYYSYNNEIYAEYDDHYYLYDPVFINYTPVDWYYVPDEIVSHPEDYEFDSENIQWDSNYEFEKSDYYEDNIKPEESYYDNDDDDDWDWDSGDSWDSGGTDWGSDW